MARLTNRRITVTGFQTAYWAAWLAVANRDGTKGGRETAWGATYSTAQPLTATGRGVAAQNTPVQRGPLPSGSWTMRTR